MGDAPAQSVDLTSNDLPTPRLRAVKGVVSVPAYTDFKLQVRRARKNRRKLLKGLVAGVGLEPTA